MRHIDCADVDLPYGRQLLADVRDRTETAMPQARCFKAMELALKAQALAERGTVVGSNEQDLATSRVVGVGIGRCHIVEGYLPNPDKFQVRALCDLDDERLTAVGDEFGIERRTTSFDDLLAMPTIDIIDICTPPMLHRPMIDGRARAPASTSSARSRWSARSPRSTRSSPPRSARRAC